MPRVPRDRALVGPRHHQGLDPAIAVVGVEPLGELRVEVEACAGERPHRVAVAPVPGEEAARLARGGGRDLATLDEGDLDAEVGQEKCGRGADDPASADDDVHDAAPPQARSRPCRQCSGARLAKAPAGSVRLDARPFPQGRAHCSPCKLRRADRGANAIGAVASLVLFWFACRVWWRSFSDGALVYETFVFREWWLFSAARPVFLLLAAIFVRRTVRPPDAGAAGGFGSGRSADAL